MEVSCFRMNVCYFFYIFNLFNLYIFFCFSFNIVLLEFIHFRFFFYDEVKNESLLFQNESLLFFCICNLFHLSFLFFHSRSFLPFFFLIFEFFLGGVGGKRLNMEVLCFIINVCFHSLFLVCFIHHFSFVYHSIYLFFFNISFHIFKLFFQETTNGGFVLQNEYLFFVRYFQFIQFIICFTISFVFFFIFISCFLVFFFFFCRCLFYTFYHSFTILFIIFSHFHYFQVLSFC